MALGNEETEGVEVIETRLDRAGSGAQGGDRLAEIGKRELEPGLEIHLRLPAQQGAGAGDIGAALPGIILRQGLEADAAPGAGDSQALGSAARAIGG